MASMKHVGLNVAADPFFAVAVTGVRGGLVVVSADDPSMHSSQGEQDNRHYARFAKVPLLEPSDSQEAYELMRLAFALSEEFDTPVLFRTSTRVSHSKSVVEYEAYDLAYAGRLARFMADTATDDYDTATATEKGLGCYFGDADNRVGELVELGYDFW